jgi:hypothetical protein
MNINKHFCAGLIAAGAYVVTSGSFAAKPAKPYSAERIVLHSIHMIYDEATFPYGDALVFDVTSNGCTTKDDFRVNVTKTSNGSSIEVLRINPDNCNSTPFRQAIAYSYEEVPLAKSHKILNRMGAFTGN